ncbi:hypothetical protein F5984_10660 [Rudanella paleaurantiibacter]|uniref:Uncharacterized protein n=1 Tax=Rudanella paleaurantiibacter TaxID=2614655 RepID=A0A7J5U2N9_9BACT|nr:hypothetical protein [Rudanella paleaurantiibacter]KAB7731254.1 hypothetical protein F5984_10660 [Rudanella paleaurantiibacter]
MRNPFLLLSSLFILVCFTACQRPYALVQRTPAPRFTSPMAQPRPDTLTLSRTDVATTTEPLTEFAEENQPVTEPDPASLLASVAPSVTIPAEQRVANRLKRVERLISESGQTVSEQPRPRPKSKSQLRLGNRIRESLGLPLREELNWWQRIDWKLKASVFVILVAIVFAILNLGQLALLFGLIGAVLLVLGLKRAFKKRRPWL